MKYDMGISGAVIVSAHNGYKPFTGSVAVSGERIAEVFEGKIEKDICKKWIDGKGKILMPGLVNGHCHGDMTLARGLGDDLTLLEQNEKFADTNWFYSLIQDEDRYAARQLTYCEALLSGTTFIMENMYWGLGEKSVKAMSETGIRGALAEDIRIDFSKPDEFLPEEFLSSYVSDCRKNGKIPVLGSVSEEDYDTNRLKKIQKIAEEKGIHITCHLAENRWRQEIVQAKYQTTAIDYLYQNHLLGDNMIGSHVVYVSDDEIEQLAVTDTKVVNTPLCEMKIQDGTAPIPKMVKAGITVCLGTDGAMWNNSNDIFREMKGMSLLHSLTSGVRSLKKTDILDMATINGAKCFGLEKDYGTIETGKKADFILIDTRTPHMQPILLGDRETVTSAIVFNATGSDVTDVFVDGRQIVKDKCLLTIDVTNVMERVQRAAEKIAGALSS
ncbi:MAG: amidohydrolase family protein [Hespellia sp.]|nr:amidohydrolase family protein [Hespellia sp.]